VGDLDDVSIERIVALRPDLVLLSTSQRVGDRLAQLGIASFALETDRYEDIARTVTTIGRLLGVPERAAALNARIDAEVRAVAAHARAARHGPAPKVYFEVDPGPYAAGPDSYIGGLLAKLGVRNIVSPGLGAFPLLNPEYVVRRNPDLIIVSRTDAARLADRPGWADIRAVREHRVCSFPSEVREMIMRPGPRVAEGLRAIAGCLDRVAP
ncbi:MAG TPA: ABC transporter substrate-binding protein, partial [Ideonella sp.]|nr:ABC transporter substrate-binding protein [Ideonella sp.]